MGKYQTHCFRRDTADDHYHELKGGLGETSGMLLKPDGRHTHNYTDKDSGDVMELPESQTGVEHDHGGMTGAARPQKEKLEKETAPKAPDQDGIVGGVEKNSR